MKQIGLGKILAVDIPMSNFKIPKPNGDSERPFIEDVSLLILDRSGISDKDMKFSLDQLIQTYVVHNFLMPRQSEPYTFRQSGDGEEKQEQKQARKFNTLEDLQLFLGSRVYAELVSSNELSARHKDYWKRDLVLPLALVVSPRLNTQRSREDELYGSEFERELDLLIHRTFEMAWVAKDLIKNSKFADDPKKKRSFIEVGPGTGDLVKHLAPYYDLSYLVEPNNHLFSRLLRTCVTTQSQTTSMRSSFVGHNITWEEATNGLERKVDPNLDLQRSGKLFVPGGVDLVIMSHVLYYIPHDGDYQSWVDFIVKGFNYTNQDPSSRVLVVLQSVLGHKGEFFSACRRNKYGPNDVNVNTLADKLNGYISRNEHGQPEWEYKVETRTNISPPGKFTISEFASVAPLLALRDFKALAELNGGRIILDDVGKEGFAKFVGNRFGDEIFQGDDKIKYPDYDKLISEYANSTINFNNNQTLLYLSRSKAKI